MKASSQFSGFSLRTSKMIFTVHQSNRVMYIDEGARIVYVTPTMNHLLKHDFDKYIRMKGELKVFNGYKTPEEISLKIDGIDIPFTQIHMGLKLSFEYPLNPVLISPIA